MRARACRAFAAALLSAACGAKPMVVLPTGPGVPAADAREALTQATEACRQVRSFSAEVALSGKVGGQRARGRLLAAFAEPNLAYLEAPAPFGASAFMFATVGDEATLLLPRDRRVLERGPSIDVLEAITGVALRPEHFGDLLLGCAPIDDVSSAQGFGDDWRVFNAPDRARSNVVTPVLYLRRTGTGAPWRLVAVIHQESGGRGWRADYTEFTAALPRRVHLMSLDDLRFDLQLSISEVEMNVPLGSDVFRPAVPSTYAPITLEQLRNAGPLADLLQR